MSLYISTIALLSLIMVAYPINPGFALIAGFLVALIPSPPLQTTTVGKLSKQTLAWAIVGFGATVKITSIAALVVEYFWQTMSGIAIALGATMIIGRLLGIDALLCALIGSGTAICGASAIASVGSATKASGEKISMALGVVLILNTVALFLFPYIGHLLHLSPHDFGIWAALAVHDTSSVVGAAMSYDPASVEVATTVKLARALWIAPVTILFAKFFAPEQGRAVIKLPWFIWGYLFAACISNVVVFSSEVHSLLVMVARYGFMLGIFYTGCAINLKTLTGLGIKPFLLGLLIWTVSTIWSLFIL